MSRMRALKRQIQKNNGALLHKKAVARKLGCTVPELNERMAKREKKLKEMEESTDGTE